MLARACFACQRARSPAECSCNTRALVDSVMPQHMAFGDPLGAPGLQLDHVVRMEHFAHDTAALCEAINKHSGLGLPCSVSRVLIF